MLDAVIAETMELIRTDNNDLHIKNAALSLATETLRDENEALRNEKAILAVLLKDQKEKLRAWSVRLRVAGWSKQQETIAQELLKAERAQKELLDAQYTLNEVRKTCIGHLQTIGQLREEIIKLREEVTELETPEVDAASVANVVISLPRQSGKTELGRRIKKGCVGCGISVALYSYTKNEWVAVNGGILVNNIDNPSQYPVCGACHSNHTVLSRLFGSNTYVAVEKPITGE